MLKNPVLETKKVWKGYEDVKGSCSWVLKKLNLEFLEGEFVSILGQSGEGKSTLLKLLSFIEPPDKGEVYFQGRLVGKSGEEEMEYMRSKRVRLIDGSFPAKKLPEKIAVVLLDEPAAFVDSKLDPGPGNRLLTYILYLNSCGITVIIATSDPFVASCATSIHKLSKGELEKLTDTNK